MLKNRAFRIIDRPSDDAVRGHTEHHQDEERDHAADGHQPQARAAENPGVVLGAASVRDYGIRWPARADLGPVRSKPQSQPPSPRRSPR